MSKFGKICVSLLLALVVFMGVFVGVTTKGFKDWSKYSVLTKAEKGENENSSGSSSSETIENEEPEPVGENDLSVVLSYEGYVLEYLYMTENNSYDSKTVYSFPLEYPIYTNVIYKNSISSLSFKKIMDEYATYNKEDISLKYYKHYKFYEGDNYRVSFSDYIAEKSFEGNTVHDLSFSYDITENLKEYEEIINEGTDSEQFFYYWIEIKAENYLFDYVWNVAVIYHLYDLYTSSN